MILLNLIASITFPNNEEKFHKIYGEYVLQPFRVGTESKKRNSLSDLVCAVVPVVQLLLCILTTNKSN